MAKKFTNDTMLNLATWLRANNPKDANIPPISDSVTLKDLGSLGLGAAKAHPFATAGGAITTGANLAGLFDNDKFGGQLGGLALGGLGSYAAGLNPGTAYLATTGAGALGALFDKLRAKKEQERAQAEQYAQYQ